MSKTTRKVVTEKTASARKNVLIIDNQSVHLRALQELISEKVKGDIVFKLEGTRDVTADHVNWADLVVISGGTGRSIEKNPKTFQRLVETVIANYKPVIGICLGAEAIAVHYGVKLSDIGVRRVGNVAIYLDSAFARSIKMSERVIVYEFHRWSMPEVVDPLIAIATSNDGVEIFKHKYLPVWGIQFHPEVRRKNNKGHVIFELIVQQLVK